ncbi:LOW QUALITY PROTEIN: olfactory receptor 13A1-like [Trichosurus vulpecula]|uniref:LOW QUALITY PROTEIN: olfactory receptor 13A1-like n=1 Tax=Trichosurus vulpecula TaxID=9337 RepID=UPI00186B53EF|nr:LOW QUALITY PROTEIN: olfactory receptor 13A1-like [Trichosurus vulpecula]
MALNNQTLVTEFLLQGFSATSQLQTFLFSTFLFLYLTALTGNILIVMAINLDSGLHTPMYFFLANLSMSDNGCTSTVLPKFLEDLSVVKKSISYGGCMTKLYFLPFFLLGTELLLFTAMAYDRYVAICHPLHYSTMMSRMVCMILVSSVWAAGALSSILQTGLMLQLMFCGPNEIKHFLCEIPSLLLLSCSSTYVNNIMIVIADVYFGVINFMLTILSYGFIISNTLKIRTTEGKKKAFSTCFSHLLMVTIYYTTIIYTYMLPGSSSSMDNGKVLVVLYTTVSSALNPLIYTLRNKDFKAALRKYLYLFGK